MNIETISESIKNLNINLESINIDEHLKLLKNYTSKDTFNFFKSGGKIRIKKKNRGKFTEYCGGKVTQECINKGKKSKNPTIRKRATFAQNARRWKKK